ncbi:RnfABCDGE type electron transport complex subunit D [Symbiobacterium terraclitae]|uniref:RnfABCDGE type electron transport complex subunit D n=1 Tax=Symbiobacterium terraclitae TaxID=557451 RepID=UPI0035B547A5
MSKTESGELLVASSPHLWAGVSTGRIMRDVLIALAPAALGAVCFFGWRAAAVIALSMGTAALTEWGCERLMGKPSTLADGSALVTGLLLALTLPPASPFWLPVLGAAFAIAVVKVAFGGLGHNFVNPALAARAFLLAAFPAAMTTWTSPFDAVTTATPLAVLPNPFAREVLAGDLPSYTDLLLGTVGGSLGETSAVLLLLGAAYLLVKQIIDWRIPAGFLATLALFAWVFGGTGGLFTGDPLYHLLAGGAILGAFFMATDYVTAPITARGRWIFAVGCGLITALIRLYGGYPEGVLFAILLMNVATPLIDRFLVPAPFGGVKGRA